MTEPRAPQSPANVRRLLRIALAWCLVGLPLLWGVSETVKKSLLLFK